jgi:hypothetical protein
MVNSAVTMRFVEVISRSSARKYPSEVTATGWG